MKFALSFLLALAFLATVCQAHSSEDDADTLDAEGEKLLAEVELKAGDSSSDADADADDDDATLAFEDDEDDDTDTDSELQFYQNVVDAAGRDDNHAVMEHLRMAKRSPGLRSFFRGTLRCVGRRIIPRRVRDIFRRIRRIPIVRNVLRRISRSRFVRRIRRSRFVRRIRRIFGKKK